MFVRASLTNKLIELPQRWPKPSRTVVGRRHNLRCRAIRDDVHHRFREFVVRTSSLVSASAVTALLWAGPSNAEMRVLAMSRNEEIFRAQTTLLEVFSVVRELFVDSAMVEQWGANDALEDHVRAAAHAANKEAAYSEISLMLEELKDPYTRVVNPEEYADFRVGSDGAVTGVGLILGSTEDKHLVVLAPTKNSPAERAGVRPGDVIVRINGISMDGIDRENAAKLLRGKRGTNVQVQVSRVTNQIPGVPGRPEPEFARPVLKNVNLRRDVVKFSPVYAANFTAEGKQIGYIRLMSFAENASREVKRAMLDLAATGARGFILDLRNNPGGLVSAGLDIARLWMNGPVTVFNIAGRDAVAEQVRLDNGRAVSDDPLVVLVNNNSASASEILAGALHDNGRAQIVGDSATYGKGKIQNLYELSDGSALFVTVARYQTPNMTEIDHVGIRPDVSCKVPLPEDRSLLEELEAEEEEERLYGPMSVNRQLLTDPCFKVAEQVLAQQMALDTPSRVLPYTGPLKLMSASTVIRHR